LRLEKTNGNSLKLTAFLIFAVLTLSGCSSLLFPRNVKIADPELSVKDARLLIKNFNETSPAEKESGLLTRYGCRSYQKARRPF